jgi:hypothetical protein
MAECRRRRRRLLVREIGYLDVARTFDAPVDPADEHAPRAGRRPTTVDALAAAIPGWAHADLSGSWSPGSRGSSGVDSAESIAEP